MSNKDSEYLIAYEKVKQHLERTGQIHKAAFKEIAGKHAFSIYLNLKETGRTSTPLGVYEASEVPNLVTWK